MQTRGSVQLLASISALHENRFASISSPEGGHPNEKLALLVQDTEPAA
jgi:hypothetical protein